MKSLLQGIKGMFIAKVSINDLMGPIGISGEIVQTTGIINGLILLAVVSLGLGITNLLPFPPLDGGKVVFIIIEAIRKKPFKEKTEYTIQTAGFALLIGLSLIVAYNDILRIFGG